MDAEDQLDKPVFEYEIMNGHVVSKTVLRSVRPSHRTIRASENGLKVEGLARFGERSIFYAVTC